MDRISFAQVVRLPRICGCSYRLFAIARETASDECKYCFLDIDRIRLALCHCLRLIALVGKAVSAYTTKKIIDQHLLDLACRINSSHGEATGHTATTGWI